jgi:CheY-like chemotaxis protein
MDIVCQHCSSKFKLPDGKIPAGKTVSLPCPKCKSKIEVVNRQATSESLQAEMASSNYDSGDRPFDFIEEEGDTALVCESDPNTLKKIVNALNLLEYHVTSTDSGRDALKKMRYHQFDLIAVNETFNCDSADANMVLLYLERLNMHYRRNMFVVMLSNKYRTMDQMMAFRHSVNIIVNNKNVDDIGKIIQRSITDHEFFYRVYLEAMKDVGKV